MEFSNVKNFYIPEGKVKRLKINGIVVWPIEEYETLGFEFPFENKSLTKPTLEMGQVTLFDFPFENPTLTEKLIEFRK